MPPVAEHHVADDQEAPFVADHLQREIDRAAGARIVGHWRGQKCGKGATKKRLQYRTSYLKLQPVAKYNRLGGGGVAKLIMWNLMTLDGFVEGENRDISWHLDVWGEELERLSIEQLGSAGGLMFGRVTYQLMANYWPDASGEVADLMNALPKYVFSRTLTRSD